MQVKDIMTPDPACATPDTTLQRVAELMVQNDCGEIPIVGNMASMVPVGVITDRDITCRTVAKGLNPLVMRVMDCMSQPALTVVPDMTIEACCSVMEDAQIRRVVVVDASGACVGIVAQADIARHASKNDAGEVVREVSEPGSSASAVG
ncbi:MAG: CBS domain-containing protein [Pyrinomonadaceae bacterium]